MGAVYTLPARLEGPALGEVKAELLARRGGDLSLVGEGVERINGLGLQLLMAALAAWPADGHRLCIQEQSDVLRAALLRLNIIHDECEEPVS